MGRDEERLGALLRLAAPPSEGVAFEDVARAVRHRRAVRASLVGAVAVGVAAAAGIGVVLQGHGTPDRLSTASSVDLSGAVPWTAAPVQGYVAPPAQTTAPATDARPCTASDVSAAFDGQNGAAGHLMHDVRFRNTSTSTCVLQGYPTKVTATEPGKPGVVATDGTYFPDSTTANMPPGGSTVLVLETVSMCPAFPGGATTTDPYHRVAVQLPGGGTVVLDAVQPLDLTCGLHTGRFFVEQPPPAEPHDPLSDLQAAVEAPASVRPGATLVYVVDLTNPTGQTVTLDRCPSYVETATGVKEAYQLNCAAAAPIGPGATERFEMRLPVPATAPAGPLSLTWAIAAPFTVIAQGTVQVTAS